MVELVYKFDEKSYCECLKGESISKVRFKYFSNIYMDTRPDHLTLLALHVWGNNYVHIVAPPPLDWKL